LALKIKDIEYKIKEMSVEEAIKFLNSLEDENAGILKLKDKVNKRLERYEKEKERLQKLMEYERAAKANGYHLIAGLDEAGRGPLAGPVAAAAVILPDSFYLEGLNDSKKVSPNVRDRLYDQIVKEAVSYSIVMVDNEEIDKINILNATKKAMSQAVRELSAKPDFLLLDAIELKDIDLPQLPLIKGDSKSASIAAASILAKVTRDRWIEKIDGKYPQYGFAKHKGYGTSEHIEAIGKYGLTEIHRRTFSQKFVV